MSRCPIRLILGAVLAGTLTPLAPAQPAPAAPAVNMGQFTPMQAASLADSVVRVLQDPALAASADSSMGAAAAQRLTPEQVASVTATIKDFQTVRAAPDAATQFTPGNLTNLDATIRALQDALARGTAAPGSSPAPATAAGQLSPALAASLAESVQMQRNAKAPVPGTITNSDLPNLQVALQSINENRSASPGGGSTNLSLLLSGTGLPYPSAVRQVSVTKALDEQDRTMLMTTGRGSSTIMASALMNSQGPPRAGRGNQLNASASLGLAPRSTTRFKLVEGTIDVFIPTETNGGIIRVPNIRFHNGRLEHPELSKRGAVVIYIADKDSYDEAAIVRTAVARGSGAGVTSVPDGVKSFGVFYSDSSATIAGAQLQDAQGNPLATRSTGNSYSSTWGSMSQTVDAGIPADAQLVIFLAVPEAIKKISFRLDNIDLP